MKNKVKSDKNKTKYIVLGTIIFVILCCTLVPYIINIFLDKNIISSVKTDSGDWLGFWGNVIGSLIESIMGGVITIVGVLLTLKVNNKELTEKIKKRYLC